ncbi:MAG: hypothetical protein II896_07355 [Clostridia bacterium]|nr:hypothetical protein [Clostridia bacterium]
MKRLVCLLLVACLALGAVACVNMQKEVAKLDQAAVREKTATVRYIAHRGYCLVEENGQTVTVGENTEAAFRNAAKQDTFWGIETDVWETKDGVLVCMHDKNAVKGIADVHEADSTDVLSRPLRKAQDQRAPTFDAYLAACKEGGKAAVVEIKDAAMSEAGMQKLLSAIERSGVRSTIVSFNLDKLEYVRTQNADIECMLIIADGWRKIYRRIYGQSIGEDDLMDALIRARIGITADHKYLYRQETKGKNRVKSFHDAGLAVGVWTVDDAYCAIYDATALDVDFITSNRNMATLVADALQSS